MAITQAHIQGYRALTDVWLKDIPRFALITGVNDVGKTSVLDALRFRWNRPWMTSGTQPWSKLLGPTGELKIDLELTGAASSTQSVSVHRPSVTAVGMQVLTDGYGLHDKNNPWWIERGAVVVAENSFTALVDVDGGTRDGKLDPELSPVPIVFEGLSEGGRQLVASVSDAITTGAEEALVSLLRAVNPEIESLRIIAPNGQAPVVALKQRGQLPRSVDQFGWGTRSVASLAAAVSEASSGVLLVDELASGVHVSALTRFIESLAVMAAAAEVQVIATTHSNELIRAAVEVIGEVDLAVYRLAREPDGVHAHRVSGASVAFAAENGFDLR